MRIDFKNAMALALQLTRSGQVDKAAAEIQKALGSKRATADESRLRKPLADVVSTLRSVRNRPQGLALDNQAVTDVPVEPSNGAQFLSKHFTCHAGTREYKLYLPINHTGQRTPLLVMLHGCTQNADDFATGTRMNALAENMGFAVAYPIQSKRANPSGCWNWFNPGDQFKGTGEPAILAGITEQIVADHDIDTKRIFVAGLSAGGAMAMIMGITYPELFSGIGVHSGLAYQSANDVMSALSAMRGNPAKMGQQPKLRTIIFHGDADNTVHPDNAKVIAEGRQDLFNETTEIGKVALEGGRKYTRNVRYDKNGLPAIEHWTIAGAGHAWAGGSKNGSFTDPKGPDASAEMVRFFLSGVPSR